jgi:hypothetical protein
VKNKILLLAFFTLVFMLKINAQYPWQYNSCTSVGGVGYLQNNSNNPIIFGTNCNQQMTLLTTGDLNINGTANGYQIGGQYVLWLTAPTNYNTWVGYSGNASGAGQNSTYVGYQAGFSSGALSNNCSFVGNYSGYSNIGSGNSFVGVNSGYGNTNGDFNTAMGYKAGYTNQNGSANAFFGGSAGYNTNGSCSNCASSNTFIGASSGQTNTTGSNNTTLGANADIVAPGTINDASAIGSGAIVTNNSNMVLGDNTINVGIGMSNITGGPTNKLEISYYSAAAPDPSGTAPVSTYTAIIGSGTATGSSGLQFRDLTTGSYQYPYVAGQGYLTLDDYGNVVYMSAPSAATSTGSFGLCSGTVPSLSGDEGLHLNSHNLYFEDNNLGASVNNVFIGHSCGYNSSTGHIKLDVLEASGGDNTFGINVENDDPNAGNSTTSKPLIGIRSYIPTPSVATYYNVAGWFDAEYFSGTAPQNQFAIFVPSGGGTVDIGYSFTSDRPNSYLLKVNSYAWINGMSVGSDSILKKNVVPFTYGLKAIRNLNPVSYKYNGIGGLDTVNNYIGLIAQNLRRNVPNATQQSLITKDTITHDTLTILSIYEEGVLYTAVNAIKQLDSTVTAKSTTIDSLKNVLTSIQSCLNSLCSNSHSPTHHSGGNGDSNTIVTNVTLSALNDAAILYQNSPNPFSSGTKINYYLPAGTMRATMVFYDTYGNQLKVVQLSQSGNGTLNITPDNLSSGIYSYSLVVNNNVIDTKRMLLQK